MNIFKVDVLEQDIKYYLNVVRQGCHKKTKNLCRISCQERVQLL